MLGAFGIPSWTFQAVPGRREPLSRSAALNQARRDLLKPPKSSPKSIPVTCALAGRRRGEQHR